MNKTDTQKNKPRILFFAEAVTLAHIARPLALAKALDPAIYDIYLASDERYRPLTGDLPFAWLPIRSIPSEQFLRALTKGSPVFDLKTLEAYVREDLAIIGEISPDIIVGDFRLSLSVSARVAHIPFLTITNAYWSPYAKMDFPIPEHLLAKVLGVPIAQTVFNLVRPLAFAYHALPLNSLRRRYGLAHLGYDLRRIYTEADVTLYADIPELIPTTDLPANHHYIGPIIWSPAVQFPPWWDKLPPDKPLLYVTLGSSGQGKLLPMVLNALKALPVTVIVATAGQIKMESMPENAYAADFLPGNEASARANLVICNGGSPTTQQALVNGKPVLGIASNMDQHLNMRAIQAAGAGVLLRAGKINAKMIGQRVKQLLGNHTYTDNAIKLAAYYSRYSAKDRFAGLISNLLPAIN